MPKTAKKVTEKKAPKIEKAKKAEVVELKIEEKAVVVEKAVTKKKDMTYYEAVGRRKRAVARVRLYIIGKNKEVTVAGKTLKQGDIVVNNKNIGVYFPRLSEKKQYQLPLALTNNLERFAVSVRLLGGGTSGGLDAIVLGIARAVKLSDEETHGTLKERGLLTRDPRKKERRKVGTGGKARRQKQSPKR